MAVEEKLDESPANVGPERNKKGRVLTLLALLLLSIIFLAWFDGGEEPLHTIIHPVTIPATQSGGAA